MTLSIFSNILDWLDSVFSQMEKFITNHYDNPILWVMIFVILLIIAGFAINNLSNK